MSIALFSLGLLSPPKAEACSLCGSFGGSSFGGPFITGFSLSLYAVPVAALLVLDGVLANQLRLNEVRAGLINAVLPVAASTLALNALGFGLSVIDPSPEARPWQVASAVGVGFSLASIALGLKAASHLKTVQIAPFLPTGGAGLSVSATF